MQIRDDKEKIDELLNMIDIYTRLQTRIHAFINKRKDVKGKRMSCHLMGKLAVIAKLEKRRKFSPPSVFVRNGKLLLVCFGSIY